MSLDEMKNANIVDKNLNFAGNSSFNEFTSGCSTEEEKIKILTALIEHDVESPEYIACYIRWYHTGVGAVNHVPGSEFEEEFENDRP